MTSSFVKVLARHDGPWRLYAVMGSDAKGRAIGAWAPGKTGDPVTESFKLIDGGSKSIKCWSESEQQFVLTVDPDDRATWDAEKDGWEGKVREIAREANKELAAARPPIKVPSGTPKAVVERVLALRASGMGYVKIELEVLGESRKGFWAWKIVKAAAQGSSAPAAQNSSGSAGA